MKGKAAWLGVAVMMVVLGIALVGCATGPSSSPAAAKSQADLLKACRVQNAHGGHPPKAGLYSDPAGQEGGVESVSGPDLYLVCTDPGSKQCYLGDEAAYQRYQQMAIQQSISEDMHKVSEERSDPEALQMWVNSQGGG